MKKLTTSILLAIFSATVFTPAPAEASWLSKTWKKLEKSWNEAGQSNSPSESQSSSVEIPTKWDYPESYRNGQWVGHKLDLIEYQVAGVPIGASFSQVKASLGAPTEYVRGGLRYGGITFQTAFTYKDGYDLVRKITLTNRDATTHRGIAVGDSLEKVYKAYGRPTYIVRPDNEWFYGFFVWSGDTVDGIYFKNDGTKVTKIIILGFEKR